MGASAAGGRLLDVDADDVVGVDDDRGFVHLEGGEASFVEVRGHVEGRVSVEVYDVQFDAVYARLDGLTAGERQRLVDLYAEVEGGC